MTKTLQEFAPSTKQEQSAADLPVAAQQLLREELDAAKTVKTLTSDEFDAWLAKQ
jgi:hypothetical protein